MAWDEWEQLKKQAAERGDESASADSIPEVDLAYSSPESETLERGDSGTAERREPGGSESEAAQRMAQIRHTIARFRDTTVLVPLVPIEGGRGFLTADFGGVRWIHAFTDEQAAAGFNELQGGPQGRRDCMAVLGWRLLDVVIPAMGVPCGVALDVGNGDEGVLIPPVAGIVPDAAAVDAGVNGRGERSW